MKSMPRLRICLFTIACAIHGMSPLPLQADDSIRWPAFLGSGSSGIADNKLPASWSKTDGIQWKLPLVGHGQSSPVVWDDSVIVTTVDGKMKDRLLTYCIELDSGKVRWTQTISNTAPAKNSVYISRAATTPVVDAERIISYFESGDCVAYSHAGDTLWQRDLNKDYGPIVAEFGLAASPCQTADHVIVLIEHDGPSRLLALDKKTGATAWQAERTPRRSWSSPATFQIDGTEQIIVSSAGSVDGYDAADGKLLWTIEGVGGNTGVTPIDAGSGYFLIGAAGGRQGENETAAKRSNGLVQVKRDGGEWKASIVWANEKLSPSWASPILHRGLAYWVNRVGVVSCADAETGELIYSERLKQSCWATPIAAGDRLYFFGKDGITSVIAAGRTFQVLHENELFDPDQLPPESTSLEEETTEERRRASAMFSAPTVYGAAVAGDRFVVRIGNQVFCIR
jgi:outer membrane protein assembly factor BamB